MINMTIENIYMGEKAVIMFSKSMKYPMMCDTGCPVCNGGMYRDITPVVDVTINTNRYGFIHTDCVQRFKDAIKVIPTGEIISGRL